MYCVSILGSTWSNVHTKMVNLLSENIILKNLPNKIFHVWLKWKKALPTLRVGGGGTLIKYLLFYHFVGVIDIHVVTKFHHFSATVFLNLSDRFKKTDRQTEKHAETIQVPSCPRNLTGDMVHNIIHCNKQLHEIFFCLYSL